MYIRDYSPADRPLGDEYTKRHSNHHLRIVQFDTLADASNAQPHAEYKVGFRAVKEHDREYRNSPRNRWYGCSTTEADERLRVGWPTGAGKILGLDLYDLPTPRIIKRTRVWTDEGDDLSLDRLYRGETDAMWQRMAPRERVGTLRVTLFAELGINCDVQDEVLFWRGATSLRLADLLQKAGYAVRLLVGSSCHQIGTSHSSDSGARLDMLCIWPAKNYADPLDIDNLAVTIASAAFFRRQIFQQYDNLPDGWTQHYGLGRSEVSLSDAAAQMLAAENGDLLIKVSERVRDQGSANEWLRSLAETMPQIFENN